MDVFTSRPLADAGGSRRNYLDLLDDEAVRLFMDIVPGEYLRRFPWAVEPGAASASPTTSRSSPPRTRTSAPCPWSPSPGAASWPAWAATPAPGIVLSAVHDDLGSSGRPARALLAGGVQPVRRGLLHGSQGEWMAEHGVALISNPLWDEYGPAEQIRSTGNLNTRNQWAQVPGTDLVSDHYQRGYHRTLSRWPASAAHQLGLERVYLEAMGAMGW